MLAQVRKLDRILADVRANARRVYEGVRDLPGIRFRRLPDPAGELGTWFHPLRDRRALRQFIAAMKAEKCRRASRGFGGPAGAALYREEGDRTRRGRRGTRSVDARSSMERRAVRGPSISCPGLPVRRWTRSSRTRIRPK